MTADERRRFAEWLEEVATKLHMAPGRNHTTLAGSVEDTAAYIRDMTDAEDPEE